MKTYTDLAEAALETESALGWVPIPDTSAVFPGTAALATVALIRTQRLEYAGYVAHVQTVSFDEQDMLGRELVFERVRWSSWSTWRVKRPAQYLAAAFAPLSAGLQKWTTAQLDGLTGISCAGFTSPVYSWATALPGLGLEDIGSQWAFTTVSGAVHSDYVQRLQFADRAIFRRGVVNGVWNPWQAETVPAHRHDAAEIDNLPAGPGELPPWTHPSVEELTTRTLSWSGLTTASGGDDVAALDQVVPAVVSLVEASRARREPDGAWSPETWSGAVMLAARLVRRRNSPAGIEAFTGDAVAYVRRNDPDIATMLRLNAPAIG